MIGQTLGHYRIVEKIGAGGMGEVYRAHDEHLDRDVAVKVLPVGALTDGAARKRFRKEAQALSKLSHPNIAMVFDFDSQHGVDFLAMELIPGATLSARLAEGPLDEAEILKLGMQVADGLTAAHARSDIYAAGAVLYEMATGQRPFPQSQGAELIGAILHQMPARPSTHNRPITPALEGVVMKALEKTPAQRYQTARELLAALETVGGVIHETVRARRAMSQRGRWGFASLAVLLTAGVILGLNLAACATACAREAQQAA
jgi:serine/threonine protein kinase